MHSSGSSHGVYLGPASAFRSCPSHASSAVEIALQHHRSSSTTPSGLSGESWVRGEGQKTVVSRVVRADLERGGSGGVK